MSIDDIKILLENGEIAIFFEKIEPLILYGETRIVYNRLKIEFIMGLQGLAYLDYISRLQIFAKMIIDNSLIKEEQISKISNINPNNILNQFMADLQSNVEKTPHILLQLIKMEGEEDRKSFFSDLYNKWYKYENYFKAIPDASIATLNNIKIQIKNDLLIYIKPNKL
jgi:hypothetical protein